MRANGARAVFCKAPATAPPAILDPLGHCIFVNEQLDVDGDLCSIVRVLFQFHGGILQVVQNGSPVSYTCG